MNGVSRQVVETRAPGTKRIRTIASLVKSSHGLGRGAPHEVKPAEWAAGAVLDRSRNAMSMELVSARKRADGLALRRGEVCRGGERIEADGAASLVAAAAAWNTHSSKVFRHVVRRRALALVLAPSSSVGPIVAHVQIHKRMVVERVAQRVVVDCVARGRLAPAAARTAASSAAGARVLPLVLLVLWGATRRKHVAKASTPLVGGRRRRAGAAQQGGSGKGVLVLRWSDPRAIERALGENLAEVAAPYGVWIGDKRSDARRQRRRHRIAYIHCRLGRWTWPQASARSPVENLVEPAFPGGFRSGGVQWRPRRCLRRWLRATMRNRIPQCSARPALREHLTEPAFPAFTIARWWRWRQRHVAGRNRIPQRCAPALCEHLTKSALPASVAGLRRWRRWRRWWRWCIAGDAPPPQRCA